MTIPEPQFTTDEVRRGVEEGRQFWALRGTPPGHVELFHAYLDDGDEEEGIPPAPFMSYSGGGWMDNGGEVGNEPFDEFVSELGLEDVRWHETDLDWEGDVIAFDVHRYLGLPDPE